MADKQPVNTDEYAGLGSLAAAQGQSYVDSLKGMGYGAAAGLGVGGAVALVAPAKSVSLAQSIPVFGKMVGGRTGVIVLTTLATSAVVSSVMSLTGFLSGGKKADAARAQFDTLKAERDIARAQVEGLQTQVAGLNQEISTHRKSFAELHAKHEQNASHAARHESRAEHGSHAEAALHDKENAATAERTV